MDEIATLITTTLGLVVIILVCVLLFAFILVDLIKEIRISKPTKAGKSILNYFKKKDKDLD